MGSDRPRSGATPRRTRAWVARLRRLYLTLRTEHTTHGKIAAAVGVGVFIGCSPLWGLHFALAVALAWLLRLNRFLVYAAANLANPVTGPLIVFAEIQVGHRIMRGNWPGLSISETFEAGIAAFSVDLLLGSIVVGAAAGIATALAIWLGGRASVIPEDYQRLLDRVVMRYIDVSVRDAEAARSRLLRDPIYPFLLSDPSFREAERILDLGCGRGLVAALLVARETEPPEGLRYTGVDVHPRYVRVAREALADREEFTFLAADLRDFDPPAADLVLLLNSLRYLKPSSQDALLLRLGRALSPGARILVREVDAGAGWRFVLARATEAFVRRMPGRPRYRPGYRRAADLRNALVAAGFEVRDRTTAHAAPPTRVLFEAVRKSH